MRDSLIIRTTSIEMRADSTVSWFLFNSDFELLAAGDASLAVLAAEVAAHSDGFEVSLIIPSDAVLLCQVSIPSRNMRQIKQALPYAVEELIAEVIENVHMALPPRIAESPLPIDVAIIQHTHLITYLDVLHHNQLSPLAILVDVLCVPQPLNAVSVLACDGAELIRSGDYSVPSGIHPHRYCQPFCP